MRNWYAVALVTQLVFITVIPIHWVTEPNHYGEKQTDSKINLNSNSLDSLNTLRILSVGRSGPLIFHPFISRSPSRSLIYDTLVDLDPDTGKSIPALAKQWVVTNDSKHWIFHLRNDVYFHDGSKFDAFAVEELFNQFLNSTDPGEVYYGLH